jgi:ribose/xylose/arabinose/galactoside ABC-type transport system permease subunit
MTAFLLTIGIIMLALGLVSYVSSKRDNTSEESSALSLLPGDIKYESPSGNFRFYFPITTSIVISIILTLVLHFLR